LKITIFLHTTLQRQNPDGPVGQLTASIPAGSTLADLLDQLGVELDVENTLLVVNGRTVILSQQLSDGDQVHLIPAISGG
jgi:sulfur carrier protein ThiS